MKKLLLLALLASGALSAQIPHKVVICGVCKDVADRVPYSMRIMEKIGALFSDYRIVVYENNSSDSTPDLLTQWAQKNSNVHVMSERVSQKELAQSCVNRMDDGNFYRAEVIARARNKVLDKLFLDEYETFEYVIWMDMDFVLEPAYDAFIEIFESEQKWDAVFAYGIDPPGTYWDWYAFRDDVCPLGSELLGNEWWYLPREKRILKKADDWYPVISAFGGCGIYKKEALKGCRYSGIVTADLARLNEKLIKERSDHPIITKYIAGLSQMSLQHLLVIPTSDLPLIKNQHEGIRIPHLSGTLVWRMSSFVYQYPSVCEHVTLHASMICNGYDKLFINPRLVFRYGG